MNRVYFFNDGVAMDIAQRCGVSTSDINPEKIYKYGKICTFVIRF